MSFLKSFLNTNKLERIQVKTEISGIVRGLEGSIVESDGFPASLGSVCEIESLDDNKTSAEIIGFRNNKNLIALLNPKKEGPIPVI